MSDSKETKTITLKYNGFKDIKVEIPNNYDKALEALRQKLYLTKEEIESFAISFQDSGGDENFLDEDTIEDAFNSEAWDITKESSGPMPDQDKKDKKEEDVKKIQEQTTETCIKYMNDKIKELNEKWKQKMKELKTQLTKKFKEELDKREKVNKENIEAIMSKLSKDAKEYVEKQVNSYNSNISTILQSQIDDGKDKLNKEKETIVNDGNELQNINKEIKTAVEESKNKFTEIMELSKANIEQK